jgi:hypothetical protein
VLSIEDGGRVWKDRLALYKQSDLMHCTNTNYTDQLTVNANTQCYLSTLCIVCSGESKKRCAIVC